MGSSGTNKTGNCKIENYLDKYGNHYTDNNYSVSERKNLILIIVESLNSWVINFKIDNIEVTPFLNQLCCQSNSIVALKMQPQVKDGRSSDAHFIYNTGILPLKKVQLPCGMEKQSILRLPKH